MGKTTTVQVMQVTGTQSSKKIKPSMRSSTSMRSSMGKNPKAAKLNAAERNAAKLNAAKQKVAKQKATAPAAKTAGKQKEVSQPHSTTPFSI